MAFIKEHDPPVVKADPHVSFLNVEYNILSMFFKNL